ncbi:hypothetical protein D3C76_1682050 [compost metagenome]
MIDNPAVFAINPRRLQSHPHRPTKSGERVQVLRIDRQVMFTDKEKPIPAPGNVTHHRTIAAHLHPYLAAIAIGRYVFHRHAAILMQPGIYRADRRFNQVISHANSPQIGQ